MVAIYSKFTLQGSVVEVFFDLKKSWHLFISNEYLDLRDLHSGGHHFGPHNFRKYFKWINNVEFSRWHYIWEHHLTFSGIDDVM